MFLFVDLYLSPEQLARKLLVRQVLSTSRAWQFHTHGSWVLTSWILITQDSVSLSPIDWLKTSPCTGCYLIVFFSLPQSCILTRDASSTTSWVWVSERVIVVNIKWEMFQLYHGEIKLHFEEMMFALYHHMQLDFHRASSLIKHIAPLGHVIRIPSKPIFVST